MDTTVLIGVIGASTILIAFVLNQFQVLKTDDLLYDILNVFGAALLIWYAYLLDSVPFLVLNSVWFVISLKDVVMYLRKGKAW